MSYFLRRALLSLAVLACLTAVAQARAADQPHLVVWSGSLQPGQPATGVELRPDGTGRILTADAHGTIHVLGGLHPTARELSQIRSQATDLLHKGPLVTHSAAVDGGYVTVSLQQGASSRLITDTGADSPGVTALLDVLNQAIGDSAPTSPTALPGAGPSNVVGAPATAACPPGQQATEVVKALPLSQAVAARMAELRAKGAIGGDSIAVDARWKDVVAPARIVVHLEVERELDAGHDSDYASKMRSVLNRAYQGYVVDGQPVNFTFDVVNREHGAPPRPCFHEILMHTENDVRSYVTAVSKDPQGGEWSAKDSESWPHEVAHLLGLRDEYDDYFHSASGVDIKLPQNGLQGDALQAALDPHGLSASSGYVYSKPHPGYEHDLLGVGGRARLNANDLGTVVAHATDLIVDEPGDVLVSKDGADQNMVTGAHFELPVPYEGTAHVDGLVAYCIDILKEPPARGITGYDVLGSAGSMGTPAMDALQRVADVVAAREPGPLQETPGANDAIWRVSDDADVLNGPDDDAARSILQTAGVPVDTAAERFAAPHFADPAAGDPDTAAVTSDGVVPPPADPVQGALPVDVAPKLAGLTLSTHRLRVRPHQRAAVVGVRVALTGAADDVALRMTVRRGAHTITVARAAATSVVRGGGPLALIIRSPRPGHYRVVAQGARGGQLSAALSVSERH